MTTREPLPRYLVLAPLCLVLWLGGATSLSAQEYRYELGGEVGTAYYISDGVRRALAPQSPSLGLTARYNANLRLALVASMVYHGLRGNTQQADNVFPSGRAISISASSLGLRIGGEYHWYPLSDKYSYLGTRRISPYLGAGLALTAAWGSDDAVLAPGGYIALGVKYKVSSRLTASLQWSLLYTTTDRLDALSRESAFLGDPYRMNASSLKGKDGIGAISLGLSYSIGRRSTGDCR